MPKKKTTNGGLKKQPYHGNVIGKNDGQSVELMIIEWVNRTQPFYGDCFVEWDNTILYIYNYIYTYV